ncbi:MAG: lipopolysaccharide transport periplasmic protein LptA [Gammaproteobacteria bacterium]|nr:lipopolysaccharide transport periplasmic protein LptA [Gammaproteobacteria bacterium]
MIKALLTAAAILLFITTTFSFAGERSHIEAQRMEWSEAKGLTTFFGSVRYRYPAEKITILADRLEVHLKDNKLQTIIAEGNPVHFEQLGDADKLVKGQSSHLYYDAEAETVKLNGEAQLQSANHSLQGEVIIYDVQNQTAEVAGGEDGKRFEAIIQPSSKQDETP